MEDPEVGRWLRFMFLMSFLLFIALPSIEGKLDTLIDEQKQNEAQTFAPDNSQPFTGDGGVENMVPPDEELSELIVIPGDLYPGLQICIENTISWTYHDFTVVSNVFTMPHGEDKGGMMEVVRLQGLDGEESTWTLAKMGVLAYPGSGTWSNNFTLRGTCGNTA